MNVQIQSITPDGMHFIDEYGEARYIDFYECYQNFAQQDINYDLFRKSNAEKQMSDEEFRVYFEENRLYACVGGRNSIDLYIEFYTDPVTRIEFDNTGELFDFATEILRAGWWLTDYT